MRDYVRLEEAESTWIDMLKSIDKISEVRMTETDFEEVLVSVCVITFNHAEHISQTLDGILRQKTHFRIEILVHDDASNDGTVEILREYERAYPNTIRVQEELVNQYSKYTSYFAQKLVPMARGKYIALCEGDDYWSDENKLEVQVNYLEKHPDCAQCCHAAIVLDSDSTVQLGTMGYGDLERDLNSDDLIVHWDVPTASRVIRKAAINGYSVEWPEKFPVGDFPTAIYSSLSGSTHYIPKAMCVYRYRSKGSWTEKVSSTSASMIDNAIAWISMLNIIDEKTANRFHGPILQLTSQYVNIIKICSGMGRVGDLGSLCEEAYLSQPWGKRVVVCIRRLMWLLGYSIQRDRFGEKRTRLSRHA